MGTSEDVELTNLIHGLLGKGRNLIRKKIIILKNEKQENKLIIFYDIYFLLK